MKEKWWKNAVIYQIYPRSFMDANNDGVGDLKGIISKLDYLSFLGIDAIWLSPIYESPMEDNGYDVSNYFKIAPVFGTMEDMDELIAEAKKRNIRIIMDLVANHTSKEHVWFKQALKGKDNPYHDFFYWQDQPDQKECSFGGSSWEYVPELNEYYYHYFAKGQVDLNWTNPQVRKEVANIVNWWLDKGVAGFRMDAIELIGKDLKKGIFANGPKIHEYLRELNENSFGKKEDSITVGEGWPTTSIALDYTRPENHELDMMFQFESACITNNTNPLGKYDPVALDLVKLKEIFERWHHDLYGKAWNAWFWENHDLSRSVSRFGDDRFYRVESAKALAIMLLMTQGTPYIYQGEEIGMTNAYYKKLSDYDDIDAHGNYQALVVDKKIATHEKFMEGLQKGSRDNSRTPMQWNDSINAGFNIGAKTWLKVVPNYKEINVEKSLKDKDSILYTYKDLIALRKSKKYKDLILNGTFQLYLKEDPYIMVYEREWKGQKLLVVINFDEDEHVIDLPLDVKKVVLSNYKDSVCSLSKVTLRQYEAIIFER